MLEISWIWGDDFHPSAICWVVESKRDGVQPLTVKAKALGQRRIRAVHGVATAWVVQRGEMHADLVGAASFQVDFQQGCLLEGLQGFVVCDGVFAFSCYCETPTC